MKRLTHIEILEEEGFRVVESDIQKVQNALADEIELKYDPETLMVYDEAGRYIADLIDCR